MSRLKQLQEKAKEFSVLYVEDDRELNKQLTRYLKKIFGKVKSAKDGEEGLYCYKNAKFDLVITDIKMPKVDGIVMSKEIKSIDRDQKIVIVSAYTQQEYLLEAMRLNVNGYILKPIDYAQINEELYKVVSTLSEEKENALYKKALEKDISQTAHKAKRLEDERAKNYELTLFALVDMIESRDSYTAGHSHRVATYSKMIAQKMGYSKYQSDTLFKAGILHDIGKVSTPDAVLLKPGSLSDLEYSLIQEHVSVGYQILNKIPMYEELSKIIHDHHEKIDGSGYPRGIKKDKIHPLAKIMSVADAFDAMTTNRIYKRKKTIAQALEEIERLSGIHYCSEVVFNGVEVLKDVDITQSSSQNPSNALEQERFAYFFKDQLTNLYNKHYLESLLIQNSVENRYCCCEMIYLHKFTKINTEFGWSVGDMILKEFAADIEKIFQESLIFRLYGDDFLVLHTNRPTYDKNKIKSLNILKKYDINVTIEHFKINDKDINSTSDIERIFHV